MEINSLGNLYSDIEAPLLKVLQTIERNGVLIDESMLEEQSDQFGITLKELESIAHRLAGVEFNLSSPKQLQEVLYDKLSLPILKKTP